MAKFNVGDKVRCVDDSDRTMSIKHGEVYVLSYAGEYVVELEGFPQDVGYFCPARFELVEEAPVVAKPPTFDLRNTKIDVKAYAEKYGLTLEGANKEIQAWLLENTEGYVSLWRWDGCRSGADEVDIGVKCLFVDQNLLMQCDYNLEKFNTYSEKEVTMSRQVVLTPSYVEEELVEFGGKKYNKREFLTAIANVKEKTNEC